jgi:phosphodiesterase/alkaline phosphatase D-like protein
MHTDKKRNGQLDRRSLLKGAGLAAGAAAATTAAGACEKEKVASSDTSKPQHGGYRETESVKTYYRLARF